MIFLEPKFGSGLTPLPSLPPRVFAAYKLLYLHTWDSSSPVASHCHTHAPAEIHREEISKLPVAKNHLSHRPNTKNLKIRRTRLAKFWDLKVLTTGRRVSTMSPTFYKKKMCCSAFIGLLRSRLIKGYLFRIASFSFHPFPVCSIFLPPLHSFFLTGWPYTGSCEHCICEKQGSFTHSFIS